MKLFFEVRFKEEHIICRLHGVATDVCENVCSTSYDLIKMSFYDFCLWGYDSISMEGRDGCSYTL